MTRYVGIDLHKRLIVGQIVDPAGKVVATFRYDRVDATSLAHIGRTRLTPDDHVVLEATAHCWAVVRALQPFVAKVIVSNPMATKAIAQAKIKTDKVDAAVLSHLLRLGYLPEVWQPDTQTRDLREWTARRGRLVSQRTALINRVRGTLAQRLLDCPEDVPGPAGRDWIAAQTVDPDTRWLLDSDLRLLDAVQAEIAAIEQQLAKRGHVDERVKLLMTLPGVSLHTAQALLAAIGDVSRFPNADKLAGYLGLVPSTRQSAERCYHGPITKQGRVLTRWLLIQAAHTMRTNPGPLGHFFRRMQKRKPYNVAIVAVAHKLAILAWHLLVKNEPYRYALPRATEDKLRDLRVAATGERRRGGLGAGIDPRKARASGQKGRTQRGLGEVYQNEGVPAAKPAPAGERRHIAGAQLTEFAERLQQPQVVPRRTRKKAETTETEDT